MNQPDPTSDTPNLSQRQHEFAAEADRKQTVMNAAALALAMRLNAYSGIDLPAPLREGLEDFRRAQQAYMDVVLRPANDQAVAS
jgi:hypothetical protein